MVQKGWKHLFSRSFHDQVNADVPCYGLVSMLNLTPWWFKNGIRHNIVPLQADDPCTGHITLHIWRHQRYEKITSIVPHRIVRVWVMCHSVRFVMTHRLICQMTYLNQSLDQVTDASRQEEYDVVPLGVRYEVFLYIFLVQKLFAKTLIMQKSSIFSLICPGKVKMWPRIEKLDVVGFKTA